MEGTGTEDGQTQELDGSEPEGDAEETQEVTLEDATDEELDKILSGEIVLEEPSEETSSDQKESNEEEPAEEAEKEEQKAAPKEEQTDSVKLSRKEYEALLQGMQKQQSQIAQQELYIKQRSSEIGELRKELKQAIAVREQGLDEKFQESPREALQQEREIGEIKEQLNSLDSEEAALNHLHTAQKVVSKFIKPEEADMPAMIQCLEEDGIDPQIIRKFEANPYLAAQPETIIQLHKRAHVTKLLKKLVDYTQQVVKERDAAVAKAKTGPGEMLSKVKENLKKSPDITGTAGRSGKPKAPSPQDMESWSDAELDEFLASAN